MSRFRHISYETCRRLPFISSVVATILSGVLLSLDMIHYSESLEMVKIIYEILVVTVGFFVVFCFSWILHYCWYQLIGIMYTYVFFVCLWLCRYTEGLFAEYIVEIHAGLFVVGIIYCILLFRQRKDKNDDR